MKTYDLFYERIQSLTETSDDQVSTFMKKIGAYNADASYLLKKEINVDDYDPEDLLVEWLKMYNVSMKEAVKCIQGRDSEFFSKLSDARMRLAKKSKPRQTMVV